MTRKDFQLIADVIKDARDNNVITKDQSRNLASMFCSELHKTNERFDSGRFISACLKEEDK